VTEEISRDETEETSDATESADGTSSSAESNGSSAEESQPSAEDVARWRKWDETFKQQNVDPTTLAADYTRKAQEAAEAKRLNEQWQQHFQRQNAQQQQSADPLSQWEAEYKRARSEFDADAEIRAMREIQKIHAGQIQQAAAQQALQAFEVREGLKRAKKWGIDDPAKLHQIAQTLTAEEIAMVGANREQRLGTIFDADRVARERKAAEAETWKSGAGGGGRRVPGSLSHEQPEEVVVPASVYYAVPERVAKKKWPNARVV